MAEVSDESSSPQLPAAQADGAGEPPGSSTFSPDSLRALCAALDVPEDQPPGDPDRVAGLASILAEFVLPLYQLTWATWRTIAPNSPIRRTGNLQRTLAGFVSGEVSREQLAAELQRLRQMTASLVAAIGQVSHHMTNNYLSRFQPGEIEQVIAAEGGGGLFKGLAARCWEKYLELSTMLDKNAVDAEIRRAIGEHVEQLMKGSTPPPPQPSSSSVRGGDGGSGSRSSRSGQPAGGGSTRRPC
jgi:hypothetical protein